MRLTWKIQPTLSIITHEMYTESAIWISGIVDLGVVFHCGCIVATNKSNSTGIELVLFNGKKEMKGWAHGRNPYLQSC